MKHFKVEKKYWTISDIAEELGVATSTKYNVPEDFNCVKEVQTNTQLGNGCNTGNQLKTEKLFIAP